jgi:hypothetical protein
MQRAYQWSAIISRVSVLKEGKKKRKQEWGERKEKEREGKEIKENVSK